MTTTLATPYTHDTSCCFSDTIGDRGLSRDSFTAASTKALAIARDFRSISAEAAALFNIATEEADLAEIQTLADRIKGVYTRLIVLGTGGSSLGARMLCGLKTHPNIAIDFLENLDPISLEQTLNQKDLKRCFFLCVSKSGSTVETLTQTLVAMDAIRTHCSRVAIRHQMAIVTGPQESPMRRLAHRFGLTIIPHPTDIGGRFSVLTAVGLLPALVAGHDIKAIRRGAARVIDSLDADDINDCPAAEGAAILYGLNRQGYSISVLMPYADRLFELGAWYRQLTAESLGKDGQGLTPVRSLGAVDQHSQLQLYLDGPKDKIFTLLCLEHSGLGPIIPSDLTDDPALSFLVGHRVGDVMEAEQQATADTLSHHGCPVRLFRLENTSDETIGGLLMHFMLETVILAGLMNINAFDQPAVEDGKRRIRELLSQGR